MKPSFNLSCDELILFDTHCHLDFDVFSPYQTNVIDQAQTQGVKRFVVPATTQARWQQVQHLACQHPHQVFYGLGYHPYFLEQRPNHALTLLEQALTHVDQQCVAVGEIGLDASVEVDSYIQQSLFCAQLNIAEQAKLPIIVHNRQAHNELIRLIKQSKFTQGGVIHAFSGSEQQAWQWIDLGFKLGVGGVITYPRAQKTRRAIGRIPTEHLVLETDAPDMPLFGFQGQINTPDRLILILNCLAELKNESKQSLARIIWENSQILFSTS